MLNDCLCMFELVQVVLHAKTSILCKCSVGHDESRLNMCMLALLVKCCAQLCMCMYMVAMASRLGDDVTYLFGKGHDIFYACVWVLVLQLVTVPPPLLHRLLGQDREDMGRGHHAAGWAAERSHGLGVFSCVRREREVLGVR